MVLYFKELVDLLICHFDKNVHQLSSLFEKKLVGLDWFRQLFQPEINAFFYRWCWRCAIIRSFFLLSSCASFIIMFADAKNEANDHFFWRRNNKFQYTSWLREKCEQIDYFTCQRFKNINTIKINRLPNQLSVWKMQWCRRNKFGWLLFQFCWMKSKICVHTYT